MTCGWVKLCNRILSKLINHFLWGSKEGVNFPVDLVEWVSKECYCEVHEIASPPLNGQADSTSRG